MPIHELHIYGTRIAANSEILVSAEEVPGLEREVAYQLGSVERGSQDAHILALEDHHVLSLTLDDGTVWFCDPLSLESLFPDMPVQERNGNVVYRLPSTLPSDLPERGALPDLGIKLLEVFIKKEAAPKIRDLAVSLEDKQTDGQYGLMFVNDDFTLQEDQFMDGDATPYLLFLHGTASSFAGAFGALRGTEIWRSLRKMYGNRILAFQHRTLTQSPLQNAEILAALLPQGAALHLVTHSRGGLIGDILARYAEESKRTGFTKLEKEYLQKYDRTGDLTAIRALDGILPYKKISVAKTVRVACPASGTLLASRRLDHFFNVVMNLLGMATGFHPAIVAFKALLAALVAAKGDPDSLPGLEAQQPASPFIRALNNPGPEETIDAPLYVISGISRAGVSWRGLAAILGKLYFRTGNDLVVDTASMHNGARRAANRVQYFLDQGGNASHFNYFSNSGSASAMLLALQYDGSGTVAGFNTGSQMEGDALRSGIATGGKLTRDQVTGNKPVAILIPGLLGSWLREGQETLWPDYDVLLKGGLTRLSMENTKIEAEALPSSAYTELADALSDSHDVLTFPYDWRRSPVDTGALLAEKIHTLLQRRIHVQIVAHGTGGLLVRELIYRHPEIWKALRAQGACSALLLGSPLGGTYRIPQLLFGEDAVMRQLAGLDLYHSTAELTEVFAGLPGLLCLLPTATTIDDFADVKTWEKLRHALQKPGWPIPSENDLRSFAQYRQEVSEGMRHTTYAGVAYIAGQAPPGHLTPDGYRDLPDGRIQFTGEPGGDGSSTWDSAIPEELKRQQQQYYTSVPYGALPCDKRIFTAIKEILRNGSTTLLRNTPPEARGIGGAAKPKPQKAAVAFGISPENLERSMLGLPQDTIYREGAVPITISLSNGDCKFAAHPVLVGHFLNDGLFSAEKAINYFLHGELARRHGLGLYPGDPGTSELFIVENPAPFKGAIIAGLGRQGELTPWLLAQTVEKAVLKYLSAFNSPIAVPASVATPKRTVGISTLAIGCGYGGLSIESSVRAVITGVQHANDKIRDNYDNAITVGEIEFIELFRDRAMGCFMAINHIDEEEKKQLHILWKNRTIIKRPGSRERMLIDNNSDWWTRIQVRHIEDRDKTDGAGELRFTMSTDAAREEERILHVSRSGMQSLLNAMSGQNRWNPQLAKSMFEMLIPKDFKDQIKRQSNINWIVDTQTAEYPWELLQDALTDTQPLSVNAGMVRQLATKDYRIRINPVVSRTALIVADPDLKGTYGQLPGARHEGAKVQQLLDAQDYNTWPLLNASDADILSALFARDYKIIHLAGHGVFDPENYLKSGMLIGAETCLNTTHLDQLPTVPEFVFVNCCFLGEMNGAAEARYQQRYQLAANFGTQLINNGVRAVIVAGWAVDDAAALDFTGRFYKEMFQGKNFGDAVKAARKHIFDLHGHRTNTWGAYQCYGDPFYVMEPGSHSGKPNEPLLLADDAEIMLSNMLSALDLGDGDVQRTLRQVEDICRQVDENKIRTPAITELQALLYASLGQFESAIQLFTQLLQTETASFSGATMERYCAVRLASLMQQYRDNPAQSDTILQDVDRVIGDILFLRKMGATSERLHLLGSAYKRKAFLSHGKAKKAAYRASADCYREAAGIAHNGLKAYSLGCYYLLQNALSVAGSQGPSKEAAVAELRQLLLEHRKSPVDQLGGQAYRQLVTEAHILMGLHFLQPSATSYQEAEAAYKTARQQAAHPVMKQADAGLFDFIDDVLSMAGKNRLTRATNARQQLDPLRKLFP
ncbi:CHAT domain-containing protein [Chitinophaga pollutisoli]|uniref:CHAT domain-containing protein n=1 Tax=Chitinophaga pollutisoli TaxID=3133966 RepID=A0ABZ2YNX3_9BACT